MSPRNVLLVLLFISYAGLRRGGLEVSAWVAGCASLGLYTAAYVAEATGSEAGEGASGEAADGADKAQLSEAEAELAAQRVERERIARRKAEKKGAVESGAKLSGKAADLLAAVRAVESGAKPVAAVFGEPEPPRRPASEAARPRPVSAEAERVGAGANGSGGGRVDRDASRRMSSEEEEASALVNRRKLKEMEEFIQQLKAGTGARKYK